MNGLFFLFRQSAKARYLVQSAGIFALNLTVTVSAHELLGLSENVAFGLAILTVIVAGFLSLKYFVYQATEGDILREFLAYLPSVGLFAVLQYGLFLLVHDALGFDYRLGAICAQGTTFIGKFFFYRAFVFRRAADHSVRTEPSQP